MANPKLGYHLNAELGETTFQVEKLLQQ